MVGILDHASFSNITEQHKMLYQDTLGPWLTMIQEEIALQLIPDFEAKPDEFYASSTCARS
jgi:phage portal protein BeeE